MGLHMKATKEDCSIYTHQFVPGGVRQKSDFLWQVKLCILVDRYQRFEGKLCHSIQSKDMMEAASYTCVPNYTAL
jgi:hypothetical protein